MDDFVKPIPVRLPLAGGQYIDVRKRLTHGETEDMYARIMPHGFDIDRREVRTAKIVAYLTGWSLTLGDKPVPMSPDLPEQTRRDTIRSLDPDRAFEIYKAIEAHEQATDEERAAQKKILNGGPDAPETSTSPGAVAGVLAGSVN